MSPDATATPGADADDEPEVDDQDDVPLYPWFRVVPTADGRVSARAGYVDADGRWQHLDLDNVVGPARAVAAARLVVGWWLDEVYAGAAEAEAEDGEAA